MIRHPMSSNYNAPKPPATIAAQHGQADATRRLHELEVHQIELAMQNAELRAAREPTDALLARYTDLYDFAPVGYFTLAASSTIRLVNLTGAMLVGIERSRLVGRSFGLLVSPDHRAAFDAFLAQVFAGDAHHSIDSELMCNDQPPRHVNISAQRRANGEDSSVVVADNGKGFNVDGHPSAKTPQRLGLIGMRERVEMIGGIFSVESAPGHPTTVRVEVPAAKPSATKASP